MDNLKKRGTGVRYTAAPPGTDPHATVMEVGPSIPKRQRARMSTPEALHLAGLWAVAVDLDFVIQFCDRLTQLGRDRDERNIPRDPLAAQAFWVAALVAYARCFDAGSRGVALSYEDVAPQDRAWHQTFMTLRDLHIAHPVDVRAEEYAVDATLTLPESGHREVTGVVIAGHKEASGSSQQVRELRRIAAALRELVGKRVDLGRNAVLVQARGLPLDQLYATPSSRIVLRDTPGPNPGPARRLRRRKSKGHSGR